MGNNSPFRIFKDFFLSLFRGDLLDKLRINDYWGQIAYAGFLLWLIVMLQLMTEKSLAHVETNRKILTDMKTYVSETESSLVRSERIWNVRGELSRLGSDVDLPTDPATRIIK